ncbi:alpha-hydroxy-acid oxidizing protein [Vibrio chagasii]|nr:alpha-hydroxy-acid oxidizing protein [Vibrio chagasii]
MIISASTDYRAAAKAKLPPFLFHYIDGGSYGEHALRRNTADLAEIAPASVLNDMSDLNLETGVIWREASDANCTGACWFNGYVRATCEVQAAKVADNKGIPFTMSTVSKKKKPD